MNKHIAAASVAATTLLLSACGGGGGATPAARAVSAPPASEARATHSTTIRSDGMADTVKAGQTVDWRSPLPGEQPADGQLVMVMPPGDWTHGATAGTLLVRRVVGVGSDNLVCCGADGRLARNGVPLTESYVKSGDVPSTVPFDVTVPQGRVWVMGDNRSDADDSRYHVTEAAGTLPLSAIVGYVTAVH